MKLVTTFYGMCLCVGNKKEGTASVRLLNATPQRKKRGPRAAAAFTRDDLPQHHPLLLIPAANVDLNATTWQPMASVSGFATSDFQSGYLGWYLSGTSFAIGEAGPVHFTETYGPGDVLPPPSSTDAVEDYRDWRRLPNLAAIRPGSRIRKDFATVGENVLSNIDLQGGTFSATTPATINGVKHPGSHYSWAFSPHYSQVVSDQFQFECTGDRIVVGQGATRREIVLKASRGAETVPLWVHHEASMLDKSVMAMNWKSDDMSMPHWTAFYSALEGGAGPVETPVGVFRFNRREAVAAIDSPTCPPAVWIEFWNWVTGQD